MNEQQVQLIAKEVTKQLQSNGLIEIEASGRHVHLSRADINRLFGDNYQLTKVRELSQPHQYVCQERVTLVGKTGVLSNVVILGPERKESQIEVSQTDARILGITVPVKESGDIANTPGLSIVSPQGAITLIQGLIIAKNHIHMTPENAQKHGLKHGERVRVKIESNRSVSFDDVVVRVSKNYATFMHIDFDEANACGFYKGLKGRIIKEQVTSAIPSRSSQILELTQKTLEEVKQRMNGYQSEMPEKKGRPTVLPSVANKPGHKRLYTEETIKQLNLPEGSELLVDKQIIMTALARDYINQQNYQIVVQ